MNAAAVSRSALIRGLSVLRVRSISSQTPAKASGEKDLADVPVEERIPVIKGKMPLITMDNLIVSDQPYQPWYDKENKTFNRVFLLGIVVFSFTVAYIYQTDDLHWGIGLPPKSYRNRKIYKETSASPSSSSS